MFSNKIKPLRNVDQVLETFHKAVADLEDVAQVHEAKAAEHKDMMEKHFAYGAEAKTEAFRARGIAQKMKEIFK